MSSLSRQFDVKFIAVGFEFATILSSSFCSCILFAVVFGAAGQAGILSAASIAEMADVEQMKKIASSCEISFGQYVCELMFGVDVPNLNLGIQINPIKQSIQSNPVGS